MDPVLGTGNAGGEVPVIIRQPCAVDAVVMTKKSGCWATVLRFTVGEVDTAGVDAWWCARFESRDAESKAGEVVSECQ